MPGDLRAEAAATAIVVGGGFGGLAAALRLRARGYHVTIIDRCARLGGRAQVFERDGFRHDAGPTVITAPFLFEELFGLFGKKMSDYVTLVTPDPWYRFHFSDGATLDYGPTQDRTEAEIARFNPADVAGFRRLIAHSKAIYDVAFTKLSDRPFHSLWFMIRQIPDLLRLKSYESVWKMVSRHLTDDRLRQAFSVQPLLVGGNPYATTSIYGLITYVEQRDGIWFAMGGTGTLVDALSTLMTEEGIEIRTRETVDQIELENGRACGVRLASGQVIRSDVVVTDVDPVHLYRNMLPQKAASPLARFRAKHATSSMGLYVMYFGARQQWADVAHHTIWFGTRHRELLAEIFKNENLPEDFSLYVHRPTATDPSFAPAGCDSFYVLCPVPNLRAGVDWAVEGPRLRDRIVAALDGSMLPGLKDTICSEFAMTPNDFKDRYLSVDGAGFSISPYFRQSAWFRFHNRGEGIPGLYVVGAGAHPGAGLPGVVSSAKTLDHLVPAPVAVL